MSNMQMAIYMCMHIYISINGLQFYVCLLKKDPWHVDDISGTETARIPFQYKDGIIYI